VVSGGDANGTTRDFNPMLGETGNSSFGPATNGVPVGVLVRSDLPGNGRNGGLDFAGSQHRYDELASERIDPPSWSDSTRRGDPGSSGVASLQAVASPRESYLGISPSVQSRTESGRTSLGLSPKPLLGESGVRELPGNCRCRVRGVE
jgi:hypothetical protein